MSDKKPASSASGRVLKLSSLVGRVSASMLADKAMSLFRSDPAQKTHRLKNLMRNAERVVETLGQLKGAAMKVGQMLSLYEGMLPSEVSEILSTLQKEAPSVPFEVMEAEIKNELKDNFAMIKHIEPEAYASASIGQVHKGILIDGREIVIKAQYPEMDNIIKADLKNLKSFLSALFSLFTKINVEPVWQELKARLLEEIDYKNEAENLRRMADLYSDFPDAMIPKVVDELSSQRVLTLELLEGISPTNACKPEVPTEERDKWGHALLEYILKGIYQFQYLHADPNFANFAFLPEGKLIVYDFGCTKKIPQEIVTGMAKLTLAVFQDKKDKIPLLLREIGVYRNDGNNISQDLTDSYVELFQDIFRQVPPYTFGKDHTFYSRLFKFGKSNWDEASDIQFPQDVVFIDRTLTGHFGNLSRLKSCAPWRALIEKYIHLYCDKHEIDTENYI